MSAGLLVLLLAQPVAATEEPTPAPLATLHGVVVDAIRNCGARDGEIVVCSRDRGYAEGQRLAKIKRPKPPSSGGGVKVQVTAGPRDPLAPQDEAAHE